MFKKLFFLSLLLVLLDAKQIKVFFSDDFKDENSILQPFNKWYYGSDELKFSLKELYKDRWKLSKVIKTNASAKTWQMLFFMEISDKNFNKVKSKYNEKKIKKVKTVNLKEGL
jgi:hypothetical protein